MDLLKVRRGLEHSNLSLEIDTAENLAKAKERLEQQAFDAAVVDWSLPDGDALDFLQHLEDCAIELPVVVLTGHDDDALARAALKKGAQDYLIKGEYRLDALVRAVRYAIERKRAEAYRVRLQHADRLVSLGNLAAGICHEINNPMSWLLANMGFLKEQLDAMATTSEPRLHQQVQHCLGLITEAETGLQRIARTTSGLRDYARLNTERREPVDVNEVLRNAARLADHEARHRAEIELCLEDGLDSLNGDAAGLQQVFVNLVLNAVQALDSCSEENRRVTPRIRLRSERVVDAIMVSIEDSGPGVPPRLREQVFTPFFTTKAEQQGSGLGLPIAREIVSQHGGMLSLKDSELGGARFEIRLPMGGEATRVEHVPTVTPGSEDLLIGAKVLAVDDEPSILRMLSRFLPSATVVAVRSVEEALKALAAGDFDSILCDLNLRPASGADLYHQVSNQYPHLVSSFTMTTGGAVTPSLRRFEREAPVPWLRKPFGRDEVTAAVIRNIKARPQFSSVRLPV